MNSLRRNNPIDETLNIYLKQELYNQQQSMNTIKTILLGTGLSLFSFGIQAQKGTVAAGGDATGAGGSVSFSIGQVDYITATGTGGRITQGLQQPYEIFRVGIDDLSIELLSSVFPNPTRDGVTLRVPATAVVADMGYRVYDLIGNLITDKKLEGTDTSVDMISLANATYLLTVYNKEKDITTFKIIKNF